MNLLRTLALGASLGLTGFATAEPLDVLNGFGGRLHQTASREDGLGVVNRITSPPAAHLVLGMTANGAAGDTRAQLISDLGLDARPIETLSGLHRECQVYLAVKTPDPATLQPTLRFHHAAWYNSENESYKFSNGFRTAVETTYDAHVSPLAFQAPGAAAVINAWSKEKSRGLIPNLLSDDETQELDYLLANITYFEGVWMHEMHLFEAARDTIGRATTFTKADRTTVRADAVYATSNFKHVDGSTERIVELPFVSPQDKDFAFVAVLPNDPKVSLDRYADGKFWTKAIDDLRRSKREYGYVQLPKFAFNYGLTMTRDARLTQAMKLDYLFSAEANFTNLNPADARVELIKEVARIELDEKGVKAAAAAVVGMQKRGLPPPPDFEIALDRPFSFAIVEKRSGVVLFMGELQDPTGR